MTRNLQYCDGILEAFQYLLKNHNEVFVLGQGLWSPWYVGNSMKDLDKDFGKERVMDTPVSEDATTAIAAGASLCGLRPIVVHPRVDFMILAANSIANQISKWSHMLGGQAHPAVTIRGIVNRGGEQGAQHSQALHSWFAQLPGLRVVVPATARDARDLLVSSVLCDDPVLYIDDRWCYEVTDEVSEIEPMALSKIGPQVLRTGNSISLVASSYMTQLALKAAQLLEPNGIHAEVVDLRVINPIRYETILQSVEKTGHLCVLDGGWASCGLSAEIIAGVVENLSPGQLKSAPSRITLPATPAPTSAPLEKLYYPDENQVVQTILKQLEHSSPLNRREHFKNAPNTMPV